MTIKPIYSPEDQARLDEAKRLGKPKPRVKPICWELRARTGGRKGIQIKRRFDSQQEAREAWKQIQSQWTSSENRGIDSALLEMNGRMTLREFIGKFYTPHYLVKKTSPGHRKKAARILDRVVLPLIGDVQLKRFTPARVIMFESELETTPFPQWRRSDNRAVGRWYRGEGEMPKPIGYGSVAVSTRTSALTLTGSALGYARRYSPISPTCGRRSPRTRKRSWARCSRPSTSVGTTTTRTSPWRSRWLSFPSLGSGSRSYPLKRTRPAQWPVVGTPS